jgi:hypothetical protein
VHRVEEQIERISHAAHGLVCQKKKKKWEVEGRRKNKKKCEIFFSIEKDARGRRKDGSEKMETRVKNNSLLSAKKKKRKEN